MRIDGKGLLNPKEVVTFRFDGQHYKGLKGDTLASALLANDVRLVGRSFKYHRPRGVLTAGSEEPNALVTVGHGGEQDPNVRATVQEVYELFEARSQNAWPSLTRDAMAINDLMSPFLSAGFYYKTFMWPKKFWEMLYEPVIRRAAGLGPLSGKPNTDAYESAFAHCDLLVIGSGPAGLMAALVAGRAGLDVILAEQDHALGGRLLSETFDINAMPSHAWAADILAELNSLPNVRIMDRTAIVGAYDGGVFGALERVGHHKPRQTGLAQDCFWRITARHAIMATGAIERPIAFENNDRPGIMTASAVRTYLNRYGVAAGRKAVVYGNNGDVARTVRDLEAAGIDITAVVDARANAERVTQNGLFAAGGAIANTSGRLGLRKATIQYAGGATRTVDADFIAMSGGWNPSVHLACHMNGRPAWDEATHSFVPTPNMVPNMVAVGAAAGHFSTHQALSDGQAAAIAVIEALGKTPSATELPQAEDAPYSISPLWAVSGAKRAWLDFQNDVTVKDIKLAAQENYQSVEHMKRYTTQGMATDQGKNSNVAALAILADATGRSIPETGTTTFRPPFVPVPIAAMGAGAQGKGFAPERFTTSHDAAITAKAPMIEAGLWYRPSYFPQQGETHWRQSCDREVGYVRNAVGIADVSTLGKIDIQGADAGKLLDFVYTNMFSTLKVGRVRYGLMLREDGHVMDDGTTARLGETHFLMTTTTAAAGQVMRHLEFVRQALRPDWDVKIQSATEQWAQFAVAGPKSRELLNSILATPIDNETWPFMACGTVRVGGVDGRLFRISFSGEHAYEIAVPSRYGASLYDILVAKAQEMGGGAYGMEALNVLRIEKGFITHSEIHGRVTAFDIGMDGMISAKKDCIGKSASQRPGLKEENREQLVALKPVAAEGRLIAGARLFDVGADPVRVNDQGYVTSMCYSPTLGHDLALGFVRRGTARVGDRMQIVDHLRGVKTEVEILSPVVFDPKGERARG